MARNHSLRGGRWIGLCALAVSLAAPAAAIESVSGTWNGKLRCKGIQDGSFAKQKSDITVAIVDDGAGGLVFDFEGIGGFEGFVLGSAKKPATGTLSALSCLVSQDLGEGGTFHAEVKVKPGSGKASFKGTMTLMHRGSSVSSLCQVKAKRVSAVTPMVPACPM